MLNPRIISNVHGTVGLNLRLKHRSPPGKKSWLKSHNPPKKKKKTTRTPTQSIGIENRIRYDPSTRYTTKIIVTGYVRRRNIMILYCWYGKKIITIIVVNNNHEKKKKKRLVFYSRGRLLSAAANEKLMDYRSRGTYARYT